ncbi:MAG: acyl-CoA synthetase [Kiritimatiellae bacterium]|nr:acyl-CoA synthetase [Kiritimatiellia bacterium]
MPKPPPPPLPPSVEFRTSGSTGAPKSILRTEDSLQADARALLAAFPDLFAPPTPLVVATIDPDHMFGALWRIRLPALAGCPVAPGMPFSPEALVALAAPPPDATPAPLLLVTTPSFLTILLRDAPACAALRPRLRAIVTSGGPLPEATAADSLSLLGISPLEIYGSTEAGSIAWRRQATAPNWTLLPDVTATVRPADSALVITSPWAFARPWTMSDAATLLTPRTFRLGPRLDRTIKILEEPVSLPAVEAALAATDLVAEAAAIPSPRAVPRIWALAVPTPAGRALLATAGAAALTRRLLAEARAAAPGLPPAALPRRIRYVPELPRNAQGKLPADALLPVLQSPLQEPATDIRLRTTDAFEATLAFPPDAIYFRGHFPGNPILPGVVQLFYARLWLRRAFGLDVGACRILKLKFSALAHPSESLALTLHRDTPARIAFRYLRDTTRISSGIFDLP